MLQSANVSVHTELSEALDASHIFFDNISLLGFDAVAMTKKHRIPFDR